MNAKHFQLLVWVWCVLLLLFVPEGRAQSVTLSYDLNGNLSALQTGATGLPGISAPPVTVSQATAGSAVSFSVDVTSASPVTYQWQLNGHDINGATGDTLYIASVSVADEGSYTVIVTNAQGSTTSTAATLTVNTTQVVAWGQNNNGQATVPAGLGHVIAIASGGTHSLVLKSDGTVAAWGYNSDGESTIPVGLNGVVAIAAGAYANLVLKSDGTVTAWGYSGFNELNIPPGLSGVVAVAAGDGHHLALKSDGTVVAWGYDLYGQADVPIGLNGVVAIAAGGTTSLALESDGTVVQWGSVGTSFGSVPGPSAVNPVVGIATGDENSIAVRADGTVVTWGSSPITAPPADLAGVTAVAAGSSHVMALKSDGTVRAWGFASVNDIEPALALQNVAAISAASNDSMALLNSDLRTAKPVILNSPFLLAALDSHVHWQILAQNSPTSYDATGLPMGLSVSNSTGLIIGTPTQSGTFAVTLSATNGAGTTQFNVTLTVNLPVSSVTTTSLPPAVAGQSYSFQVTGSHSPTTFGATGLPTGLSIDHNTGLITGTTTLPGSYSVILTTSNSFGQGTTNTLTLLVQKIILWGASGPFAVPAAAFDAVAFSAGPSDVVALKADGTVVDFGFSSETASVPAGLNNVVAVAAGGSHALALKSDGTVTAWGYNGQGQTSVPSGLGNVLAIAAGQSHSLALKFDGTVVAWGDNSEGEVTIPAGLSNVVAIAAGYNYSVALQADSTIVVWGDNSFNQTSVPAGLTNVVAIAAGTGHVVALQSDGTVVAWGSNYWGETSIPGGLSNVVAIAAGYHTTLALKADGTVVGLGDPFSGVATIPSGLQTAIAIGASGNFGAALLSPIPNPPGSKPVITNPPFALAGINTAFSQRVVALNNPTSYSATGLPTGLSIDPGTGIISGTPTSLGVSHATISATNGAGTGNLALTFTVISGVPVPLIAVQQPAGTTLANGGTVDYGQVRTGVSAPLAFAILNNGTLNLTLGAITFDGANPTDFSVAASPAPTIAPAGSTTLSVAFKPGALGARSATMHLPSNDSTNSPFNIALTGVGVSAPVAASLAAASVTSNSATLNGTINAGGASTAASFDYGTATSYGSNIAATPSPVTGSVTTAVSAALGGLQPGTTYHFRAKGVSVAGTGIGADLTFTTLSNVATLSGFVVGGATLSPAFTGGATSYTSTVANAIAAVTITPTVSQAQAVVTVNGITVPSGTASGAIGLAPGPNTITVVVTAQDGVTTKTYTLVVTRAQPPVVTTLAATGILPTGATFNGTINAAGASTTASFVYGTTTAYGSTVAAAPGTVTGSTATPVSATVTNLQASTTYHYQVQGSNAGGTAAGLDATFTTPTTGSTLSALLLSTGALSPNFNSAVTTYSSSVSGATSSITVKPTLATGSSGTITVNGVSVASGASSPPLALALGVNAISVVVTASDGITTYTVNVTRQPPPAATTLAQTGLTATAATLNGTINANGVSAMVNFDYGPTSSYGASVSAQPSSVNGSTATAVKVALNNLTPGATYHYRVRGTNSNGTGDGNDVSFATPSNVAALSALGLDTGILSPVFSSTVTAYTATVSNSTASVAVTPQTADAHATVTVNGTTVASGSPSGPIALNAGANAIPVVVTAQDGVTKKTYTITVTRTALLPTVFSSAATGVTSVAATLNGGVNANNGATTASFDYGTAATYGHNVTAAESPVGGNASTPVTAALTGLLPGTTYHFRAKGVNSAGTAIGLDQTFATPSNVATLSGLLLSAGTLSPAFNSSTTSYSVNVTTATTSIMVKPTLANLHATVTVNGNFVASGTNSIPIALSLGPNTISVLVTAQDNTTVKTYSLVVNQASTPSATTAAATGVAGATATLNGAVNPNGGSTAATFDYGTSMTYGSSATAVQSPVTGTTSALVSATLTNLKPSTLYHFRAKAVNAAGSGMGTDFTFTTPSNVATLSALHLSIGTLSPAFSSSVTTYTATVSTVTASLTVSPTVTQTSATVKVNGTPVNSGSQSGSIALSLGLNAIPVVVTAQDGTTKTYTVNVVRLEPPSVVTGVATALKATGATFNGTVNANGASTVVTFNYGTTAGYGSTANGTPSPLASGTATAVAATLTNLLPGTTYHFQVKGVSSGGTSTGLDASFRTPSNVATLSGLLLSSASLTPAFNSNTTAYAGAESNGTATATITPTVTNVNATITVNGSAVLSGQASAPITLNVGGNVATVVVTAEDGVTKKTYTVTITRTPVLAAMTTQAATGVTSTGAAFHGTAVANNAGTALSFDYGTATSYGHNIVASPTTATGTGTTAMNATVTALIPGTLYHFRAKGVNTAGIGTGGDLTFTTPNNLARLAALHVSTGILAPAFNATTTSYSFSLPNIVTSITVTPTVATNSNATVTVNGSSVTSGLASNPIALAPGLNSIPVAVTAQDGVTMTTYTLNITRTTPAPVVSTHAPTAVTTTSATFNGAVNAQGTITAPSFDYGLNTLYGSNAAAAPSPLTGNSPTAVSATLHSLTPGTTYHYRVLAANPGGLASGADAFFTTISNVATLQGLVLSTGALDQAFSPALFSYTQTTAVGVASVTVTPTVTAGSHATVQVNSVTVASGSASTPISLSVGANNISVVVTAQDGTTQQTYGLTVNVPHGQGKSPAPALPSSTPGTVVAAGAPVPYNAQLTGPVPNGGLLPGSQVVFSWNAGRGVSAYSLDIGGTIGGVDLYHGVEGLSLQRAVTLPTDGREIYVTLQSLIDGLWQPNNYIFTTADTTRAVLQAPVDAAVLTDATVTFRWNSVPSAAEYWLSIGSTPGGKDLYDASEGAALSQSVTLPTDGRALFVTLGTRSNPTGQWLTTTAKLTAAAAATAATADSPASSSASVTNPPLPLTPSPSSSSTASSPAVSTDPRPPIAAAPPQVSSAAQLTGPTDRAVLPGGPVTFTWNAGVGVTAYWLRAGRTVASNEIYDAGQAAAQSVSIAMPIDGSPIYVTLYSLIDGQWQSNQYIFQAALPP